MAKRKYRLGGGGDALEQRIFDSEDALMEALADIAGRNRMLLSTLAVHVYDTEDVGQTHLGTLAAREVAEVGGVDEKRLVAG